MKTRGKLVLAAAIIAAVYGGNAGANGEGGRRDDLNVAPGAERRAPAQQMPAAPNVPNSRQGPNTTGESYGASDYSSILSEGTGTRDDGGAAAAGQGIPRQCPRCVAI